MVVELKITNVVTPEQVFEEGVAEGISVSLGDFRLHWDEKRLFAHRLLSWKHSGFSVDNTVGVGANDPQGRRLTQITSVFL